MKNIVRKSPFASMAALFSVAATGSPSIADESCTPPAGKGDYLIHVGKRPVWVSSLRKGATAVPLHSLRASARNVLAALLTIGLLLPLTLLTGCGERREAAEAPAATTTTPPSTTAAPATTNATAASLGAAQAAGPFQVTLTAVPEEPKEGQTQFVATVMRDGKPVEGADVELALSMPTMNMGGPTVELDHKEGGRYEGEANLSMGGMWQAIVTVKDEGETGTATYTFTAMQK